MGDVVDIRRARRHPKGERPALPLLPFCPQIKIRDHFTIIRGRAIAGKLSTSPTGQRVIERAGAEFKVSQYELNQSPRDQQRTREGDLLLTIGPPPKPPNPEVDVLAAILDKQNSPSESNSMPTGANVDDRLCVRSGVMKVDAASKGCFIGRDTVALRPKNDSASADDLLQFFEVGGFSTFGPWDWLARATTAKSRSGVVHSLKELSVPVVPGEIAEALQESNSLYEEFSHNDEPDVAGLLESRNRNEFDRRLLRLRAEA
jgi:hypothetical protein